MTTKKAVGYDDMIRLSYESGRDQRIESSGYQDAVKSGLWSVMDMVVGQLRFVTLSNDDRTELATLLSDLSDVGSSIALAAMSFARASLTLP